MTNKHPLPVHKFSRSVPGPAVIDAAYERIKAANRPIIIAGNGCIRRGGSEKLREFCDLTGQSTAFSLPVLDLSLPFTWPSTVFSMPLGIGVMSTFMAKGCVDMDADYCLYTIGLGTRDIPSLAIADADLVITLGYDIVECEFATAAVLLAIHSAALSPWPCASPGLTGVNLSKSSTLSQPSGVELQTTRRTGTSFGRPGPAPAPVGWSRCCTLVRPSEPGGCTAFRRDSNSNMLTHPPHKRLSLSRVAALRSEGIPIATC